jgi:hypothetical protein
MNHFFLIILISFLLACSSNKKNKIYSIERDGFLVQGLINKDSLFVDTLFYFNKNKALIKKEFYINGKLENYAFDYYENGETQIKTFFSNGLKNGKLYYYDSTGHCLYEEFYYYGLLVGPAISYTADGEAVEFIFKNLQREPIFYIDYKKGAAIESLVPNSINYVYSIQKRANSRRGVLLLYLIAPPKIEFKYSLLKRKNNKPAEYVFIKDLNSNLPFKEVLLPLSSDSSQFVIGLKIHDSLTNKRAMIYKDVIE